MTRVNQEQMSAVRSEKLTEQSFALSSRPSEAHHQFVREVLDRTVAKRRRKQPHQAMTVKIPYTDYARVTHVREGWELNQTDLIRFFFELALPILEAPPQDLRPLLEAHRDKVRLQRANEARKRKGPAHMLRSQQSMF